MALTSTDPATGDVLKSYPETTRAQLDDILSLVTEAQCEWGSTSFTERSACMRRAADVLRERAVDYAQLMALEMGKPVREGRAEVEKCAWVCEYYAVHAEAMLRPEPVETDASTSYVAFRPLGTVLAVMPWNFPFWQVFRFAARPLMAGKRRPPQARLERLRVRARHRGRVPECRPPGEPVPLTPDRERSSGVGH